MPKVREIKGFKGVAVSKNGLKREKKTERKIEEMQEERQEKKAGLFYS